MKIKRSKLLELVIAEQTRLRRVADQRRAREEASAAEKHAGFERQFSEAWEEFAETIRSKIAARQLIVWEDAPHVLRTSWEGHLKFYKPPPPAAHTAPPAEETSEWRKLDALRRLLEVAEDEMVSTYALEKAGFRLEHIMRTAAEIR